MEVNNLNSSMQNLNNIGILNNKSDKKQNMVLVPDLQHQSKQTKTVASSIVQTKVLKTALRSLFKKKRHAQSTNKLHNTTNSHSNCTLDSSHDLLFSHSTTIDAHKKIFKNVASIPSLLLARSRYSRVILNVGGERHEVMWQTLQKLPNTRLGRLSISKNITELVQLCDNYWLDKNEIYFDRYARAFGSILSVYRSGHLHLVDDVCVLAFRNDLIYWGIDENLLETCCFYKYCQKKEQVEDELKKTKEIGTSQCHINQFGNGKCAQLRKRIWELTEKPQSSMSSKIFASISIIFILLSIIGLNLSTIPELKGKPRKAISIKSNSTQYVEYVNEHLEVLESICTIWFTFEYALRFFVSPDKCAFVKSPMNLIDVVAILPFYFSQIFEAWLDSPLDSLVSMRKIVQMFRILRILRVFKLARHSQGLQALGYTLKQSYKELGLLMLFVILIVLLFSSLAYFAEKDDNKAEFQSIPATFWWAIITMTTVGYGDITPKTVLGKIIGSVCCICGVLVVGLPIPIIVNNFAAFYRDQSRREKVLTRQEACAHGEIFGNTHFMLQNSDNCHNHLSKRCYPHLNNNNNNSNNNCVSINSLSRFLDSQIKNDKTRQYSNNKTLFNRNAFSRWSAEDLNLINQN